LAVDPASYAEDVHDAQVNDRRDVLDPGVNDRSCSESESPGREDARLNLRIVLQNVHVGDQVNVTLSGGEPTSSR